MCDFAPYERLETAAVYPALVQKARELALAKGQTSMTDVAVMERLVREHPEVHEYLRCRTMGLAVPQELTTPLAKHDTRAVQVYAGLDFQATQTTLRTAARAEAISKGLQGREEGAVLEAYFATHPALYDVYRHKASGASGLPAHLRDQAKDVRKHAEEIVLFRTVVDEDPELRDLPRLRQLARATFRQAVVQLARSVVRTSDELKDCSEGVALDVLFSYRDDLYRLWQEKTA